MHARIAFPIFVALGITTCSALGDLPASRIVEYRIRETPSDPESDVVLQVYLDIKPVDSNGSEITWQVATMWAESVDSSGFVLATWWIEGPDVDTTDGLWRTTHADTMNPTPAEFNDLPEVWGVAEPIDEGQGDLAFAFYSAAPSGGSSMYGGNVGLATHSFLTLNAPVGAVLVDEDGEDEPVEIPIDSIPPSI